MRGGILLTVSTILNALVDQGQNRNRVHFSKNRNPMLIQRQMSKPEVQIKLRIQIFKKALILLLDIPWAFEL